MIPSRHAIFLYERSPIYEEDKHIALISFYETELKERRQKLKEIIERYKKGQWSNDSKLQTQQMIKKETSLILLTEQRLKDIKEDHKRKRKARYTE